METTSTEEKSKNETKEKRLFVDSGFTDDEITIVTADDKKLFASKGFLVYSSQVFETMLSSNFMEKKTSTIHVKEETYCDFLSFLRGIHAREKPPLTEKNVLTIARLAHMYQAESLLKHCDVKLKQMMKDKDRYIGSFGSISKEVLDILIASDKFELFDTIEEIANIFSTFKSTSFRDASKFKMVSGETKSKILDARLRKLE